jgi:hypothetical protein
LSTELGAWSSRRGWWMGFPSFLASRLGNSTKHTIDGTAQCSVGTSSVK